MVSIAEEDSDLVEVVVVVLGDDVKVLELLCAVDSMLV